MTFRHCILPILSCVIWLGACGQHSQTTVTSSSDSTISESEAAPVGDFYKRFSGTIAGKQVVLHLHRYDGAVHGNFQYTAIGETIGLHNWEDTIDDDQFYLLEAPETEKSNNDSPAHWAIRVHGRNATGTWTNASGNVHYPITLKEEYPVGSTKLQAVYFSDSASLIAGRAKPNATKAYSYLVPGDNTNTFLQNALKSIVATSAAATISVGDALSQMTKTYFDEYRRENSAIAEKHSDLESFTLNYTSDDVLSVLYNDDGLLVIEDQNTEYTGGMHGNYGSSFSNIDVRDQRLWTITDMIVDTGALRPMINDAAIAYFRLKPGEGMDQRMLVDEVPPTANVYLSNTGLTFVYNPYEIASYADGQVALFLPYKKLLPFLTPAFRARLKLAERAGVAMLSIPFK
jgi:hypothetical protein